MFHAWQGKAHQRRTWTPLAAFPVLLCMEHLWGCIVLGRNVPAACLPHFTGGSSINMCLGCPYIGTMHSSLSFSPHGLVDAKLWRPNLCRPCTHGPVA